jgi:hypothetical protein
VDRRLAGVVGPTSRRAECRALQLAEGEVADRGRASRAGSQKGTQDACHAGSLKASHLTLSLSDDGDLGLRIAADVITQESVL